MGELLYTKDIESEQILYIYVEMVIKRWEHPVLVLLSLLRRASELSGGRQTLERLAPTNSRIALGQAERGWKLGCPRWDRRKRRGGRPE